MLSDHVFSFFGRTLTITSQAQLLAIVVLAVMAAAWAVPLFRRRRLVVVQTSAVSDQVINELSRIADALDRIANRPTDQVIATANKRAEELGGGPLSSFGRERPQG